jgi:hypothetical protein
LRARLKIRPLLLRRHQRHDRGKVVRQRRSTDGKGGMRRHKANSAVGAREVQLSSTDPRSARCGGGMLAWNCMERVCGFQRTQNVPPSPKEVSSIACPTHWTRVHNASTSRKWCDGVKCALALDGRALPGGRLGSEILRCSACFPPPGFWFSVVLSFVTANAQSSSLSSPDTRHATPLQLCI